MLQEQVVPINFGQGVDTKTDPKVVIPGKLIDLQNAVFTNVKRVSKRNGYVKLGSTISTGGNVDNPKLVHSYNNELLCADKNKLLSYSSNENAWENNGDYVSSDVNLKSVDFDFPSSGCVDVAYLGNYAIYGYSTAAPGTSTFGTNYNPGVYGMVVDTSTNTVLVQETPLMTPPTLFLNPVRCVNLGNNKLAILYLDAAAGFIKLRTVNFVSAGVVNFSAETTVSAALGTYKDFDVISTSTGAALFYFDAAGVKLSLLNNTGGVASSVAIADAAAHPPLIVSQNQTSTDFWLYWMRMTFVGPTPTASNIECAIYDTSLVQVLAPTNIKTLGTPYYISNMIAIDNSGTNQSLYWGFYEGAGPVYYDVSLTFGVNSNGTTGAQSVVAWGAIPYSKGIKITANSVSDHYAAFVYRGFNLNLGAPLGTGLIFANQDQPTLYLLKLTNTSNFTTEHFTIVARLGYGLLNNDNVLRAWLSYTPNLNYLNNNEFVFGSGRQIQNDVSGSYLFSVKLNNDNTYRAVDAGNVTVLNGGCPKIYDGAYTSEFGFNTFPEMLTPIPTNVGGGAIANGTYSYIGIFQWTDNQGNLHQSAPSFAKQAIVAGPNNAVVLNFSVNYLSNKIGAKLLIYRTENNGTVYYLVNSAVYGENASAENGLLSYTDTSPDATIIANGIAYTYPGSSVLENSTPPASSIMLSHNNRLWFVNSENQNEVWYTKSYQPLVGLSPSSFMIEQLDPKFGSVTALAELDEKIIYFKEKGVFAQSGDGVNDVGGGSSLSFPQAIPSDVGCSSLKSIITTPIGVLFKSPNGIYLMQRSLSIQYLGLMVEAYNNQTIVKADFIKTKSQIRFLCSDGVALVYDYIFNQWSTFTNHLGTSACVWNGLYVFSTNAGNIYKEELGYYLDDVTAFSLYAKTAWITFNGPQNFERIRRLGMLGDFQSGGAGSVAAHGVQIQASYDFNSSLSAAVPFVFSNYYSANGPFQYRERLERQKCDSLQLTIQEITTGDALEYVDFTDLSLEAGVKKGINKLGATQSVG